MQMRNKVSARILLFALLQAYPLTCSGGSESEIHHDDCLFSFQLSISFPGRIRTSLLQDITWFRQLISFSPKLKFMDNGNQNYRFDSIVITIDIIINLRIDHFQVIHLWSYNCLRSSIFIGGNFPWKTFNNRVFFHWSAYQVMFNKQWMHNIEGSLALYRIQNKQYNQVLFFVAHEM